MGGGKGVSGLSIYDVARDAAAAYWAGKNARGECWHPGYACAIVSYPWQYYDADFNLVPGPSPCRCNCEGCKAHRKLKAGLAETESRVLGGG